MAHRAERPAQLPRGRARARIGALRSGVLAALLIGATGLHQATGGDHPIDQGVQLPAVSLSDLADAQASRSYVAVRRRTILESTTKQRSGNPAGVPQDPRLDSIGMAQTTAAAATLERVAFSGSRFDADLLGVRSAVDGTASSSSSGGEWVVPNASQSQRFETHEAYLVKHADFGIESVSAASGNYRVFVIGQGQRHLLATTDPVVARSAVRATASIEPSVDDQIATVSRPVLRLVVLPRRVGRASWILEVDQENLQVLLAISIDAAGVPLSVVETVAMETRDGDQFDDSWIDWWSPEHVVDEANGPGDLARLFPDTSLALPDAGATPPGYELQRVHSVTRELSPEASAVVTYGDGIDQLFVVSTIHSSVPLASVLPNENSGAAFQSWSENAILTYTDRDVAQFMFRATDGVIVTVVGRVGHAELSSLAADLFRELRPQ